MISITENLSLQERLEALSRKYDFEVLLEEGMNENQALEWADQLKCWFSGIHQPLVESVERLQIGNSFFDPNKLTAAYAFPYSRELAIKPSAFNSDKPTLAHELAHIYLINIPNFQEQWDSLVKVDPKDEYYRKASVYAFQGPFLGFLEPYGSRRVKFDDQLRWWEDPATFVEEIYKPHFGYFRMADSKDSRYGQKLALLRKIDAISQKQYEGVMASLGTCLN